MSSIYIHIPFCSSKCNYCNFFSQASVKMLEPFIVALIKEIELQKEYLNHTEIKTIYFGGGTPSVLSANQINLIIDTIQKYHHVSHDAEITLEANPEHLSIAYLNELAKTHMNRLSIGVQSFNSEALIYLGRKHSAIDSIEAITNALDAGFSNLSVDIIFGIPISQSCIEIDLQTLLTFNVPHISAYALTIEDKTPLSWSINKGNRVGVNEQQMIHEFKYVMQTLKNNQYHQYEISNYCRDNQVSKHNSNYWKRSSYIGLGPSAHSFNLETRQWNCSNISMYIQAINNNVVPFQLEKLTPTMQFNEYVMTSIRTAAGCSMNYLNENYSKNISNTFLEQIKIHLLNKNIVLDNGYYKLTDKGILLADLITVDLFA